MRDDVKEDMRKLAIAIIISALATPALADSALWRSLDENDTP